MSVVAQPAATQDEYVSLHRGARISGLDRETLMSLALQGSLELRRVAERWVMRRADAEWLRDVRPAGVQPRKSRKPRNLRR